MRIKAAFWTVAILATLVLSHSAIIARQSAPRSDSAGSLSRPQVGAVLYEGARLIIGDASAPIEAGAFLVQNGRISAIGRKGSVTAPAGATRVDLTGKTVIPAMINAHVHIGYEGYTSWGAENYTPRNVLDHLEREAFYGIGATTSVGSSPTDPSIQFQQDQEAGKFPPASRFFFMPGMAPPNGGPDATLMRGTSVLHAVNEVTTAQEARAAVQAMAGKNIRNVKIWVDDRRGTYPKMTPDVYNAVIDEAHKHQMMVHAHAIAQADQKAVVRAGADVLVHMVQNEPLDEEYLAILREKKPYWATVIGLGDRSEVCNNDPFIDQTYPAKVVAAIRAAASCGPVSANAVAREERLTANFKQMIANGARLVLGTDAGITNRHSFGWADHHEIAHWVDLGLTPAQAIVAATSRPAELLGIKDMGTLAVGKRADFVVLNANPLDNIRNTREIASVYLRGAMLNRDALLAAWKKADAPGQGAQATLDRAVADFTAGRVAESAAEFDSLARLAPDEAPYLWQRGIALYYAGRYGDCRAQFESHRSVNPSDVENAAWHFLCVARAESPERARAMLLPVGPDARVPMREIYQMFRGVLGPDDVLAAAGSRLQDRFYAHLYVGLYAEAVGNRARALEHITAAAGDQYADAGGYMHSVARVHLAILARGR